MPSLLESTFPVVLPPISQFELRVDAFPANPAHQFTVISGVNKSKSTENTPVAPEKEKSLFIDSLQSFEKYPAPAPADAANRTLTENSGIAFASTGAPLVEAFYDLTENLNGRTLIDRLEKAWAVDPLATLKIIFNARSIHVGKASRHLTYRCMGWLAHAHPKTFLANLRWLARSVVEKKAVKKGSGDEDFELIPADGEEYDVTDGGSHGYWKDLLNMLALMAEDLFDGVAKPATLLNIKHKYLDFIGLSNEPAAAKKRKHDKWTTAHAIVVGKLERDHLYRAFHAAVARLFAEQLAHDKQMLDKGDKISLRSISLAAKWAPTNKGFHNCHTFIVSTIAELLHPQEQLCPDVTDRGTYLKQAREAYRRLTIAPLRKQLAVVERDITAKTYSNIKYERVPSVAMNNYMPLFISKDTERFDKYAENVATGKKKVSGAVLLPSKLVSQVMNQRPTTTGKKSKIDKQLMARIEEKIADGQWKALVDRVREAGTLESSIAICDVSGSMMGPTFPDGTTPLHSSIGLSLLIAEITKPPFGGGFITFSQEPQVVKVGGPEDTRTLKEKVTNMQRSAWQMNTDFAAVFEKLLLPMAVEKKLSQEDMVKQVFVFSDMQFDQCGGKGWKTAYEHIQSLYQKEGYEVPKLIFWNLRGVSDVEVYNPITGESGTAGAPKPVTAYEEGTALVSGYSQGQLRVFLGGGQFEDEEDVVEEEESADSDEDKPVRVTKKAKMDPAAIVKKALSHKSYSMLEVQD